MSPLAQDTVREKTVSCSDDATVRGSVSAVCRFERVLFDPEQPFWSCPHPVERDGLCIYHLPKVPLEARGTLSASDRHTAEKLDSDCLAGLLALIAATEGTEATKAHEFIGFQFPPGFGLSSHQAVDKPLNFRFARFFGDVGFARRTFRRADFREAEFLGRTTFAYVTFDDSAQFHDGRFHGAVAFSSVQFKGPTFFAGSTFYRDCAFTLDNGGFSAFANFDRVRFEGRTAFVGFRDPVFHDRATFCALTLAAGASLSFTNLSLAQSDFSDTDLEHVRFIGVRWNQLNNRPSLWGEHRLDDHDGSPQLDKLAETYAQLVLNYEQRRDVDMAEAFHIGEMEVRRRKVATKIRRPWLRKLRETFNAFGVYKWSSTYGTSYTRAATILASLVLLFALLFMWTGIAPVDDQPIDKGLRSAGAPIQYQLLPDRAHPNVGPGRWLDDYARSLVFTLSIVTFQKDRYFQPAGRTSEFLTILAVMVMGPQAALLLFAIRRRFKR